MLLKSGRKRWEEIQETLIANISKRLYSLSFSLPFYLFFSLDKFLDYLYQQVVPLWIQNDT